MCPPVLSAEEEGLSNVSQAASSSSLDCLSHNGNRTMKKQNYLGLSDCSSVDSSTVPSFAEQKRNNLNLATELRLGLPGSRSSEREPDFGLLGADEVDEKPFFQLLPAKDGSDLSSQKNVVTGNKRGFSDTMNLSSEVKNEGYTEGNWIFHAAGNEFESTKSVEKGKFPDTSVKDLPQKVLQKLPHATNDHGSAPSSKAQVVGWPPVRSFRKNSLAASSKNNDVVHGKPGSVALFIKVSMDGAPFLRKVDLRTCSSYQQLSAALEKMFSCFTIGPCGQGSHGAPVREMLSESKLKDLLHGSKYVLTYEDKDGDWMLVGDVPWEMFIGSCRRLKIMKGTDVIGLGVYFHSICSAKIVKFLRTWLFFCLNLICCNIDIAVQNHLERFYC